MEMTRTVTSHRPIDPRQAAEAAVSGEDFREAMSRVAGAVHIVTTLDAGRAAGLTVTALTSISDAPPMVATAINRASQVNAAIRAAGRFAVNTLPAGAVEIADAFAGRTGLVMADRFAIGDWRRLTTGSPVLKTAIAALDCLVVGQHDYGSHTLFVGQVVAVQSRSETNGLLYVDRDYRAL